MDDLYKQVVELQDRFRNYVDQVNTPAGQSLRDEIQHLENDVQIHKNKIDIENRVKGIIRMLDNLPDETVLHNGEIDELKDRCESMRDQIRKM